MALRPVVSTRFQVLFHSPYRGSFHLSFTVLVHYRLSNVFSLGRWTSLLPTGLACPAVLRRFTRGPPVSYTGLSPAVVYLSRYFYYRLALSLFRVKAYNPETTRTSVWASPRSLATTEGILSFPEVT